MTRDAGSAGDNHVAGEDICRLALDILDRLPDTCTVVSIPDYRYVYLNSKAMEVVSALGSCDPRSAIGKRPWEVFSGWETSLMPFFEEVRSTRKPRSVTGRDYSDGGETRFWDARLIPTVDEATGEVRYITTIGTDVSKQVARENLDRTLNEINSAIASTRDLEEIFKEAVDKGSQNLEAEIGAVIVFKVYGESASYYYNPNQRPSCPTLSEGFLRRLLKGREPVIIRDVRKDPRVGRLHSKDCRLQSIFLIPLVIKGVVTGLLSFHYFETPASFSGAQTDFGMKLAASLSLAVDNALLVGDLQEQLEYRRRMEADLERYRLFFQNSRDIMFLADREGKLIEVNEAATGAYGYTVAEMVGRNIRDFRSPEYSAAVADQYANAAVDQSTLYEAEGMRKDGSIFPIEVSLRFTEVGGKLSAIGVVRDITERKQAEEAVRASEEDYRAVFNSVNESILILDSETGEVLGANSSAEKLYGYSHDEFLKLMVEDLSEGVSPFSQKEAMQLIQSAVKEGGLYAEWRAKDSRKNCFWSDVNLKTAVVGGKKVVLAVIRDITQRKEAEEALRESEERFHAIFDCSAIGIVIADTTRRIIDCNDAYERLLGYSRDELRGMTFRQYTYPGDVEKDSDLFSSLISGERDMYRMEKRYLRKSGEIVWGRLNVSIVKSPEGRPLFVIGMTEDITDRVRAVESLESERKRLRAILDVLPVGVTIADADGRVVDVNAAVEQVWGDNFAKPQDIAGYKVYKGRWSDNGKSLTATDWALARAILNGETSVGEMIDIERTDGNTATILNSAVPMFDESGGIVGGISVSQDITARRRLESQAAEYAAREAEARATLQTILETAPVGVVVVQADGSISYTSEGAVTILGRRPEGPVRLEGVQYTFLHLDGTPMSAKEFPFMRSLKYGEILRDQEMLIQRPGGDRVAVIANYSPIRDASGRVKSAVAVFTDVTKMLELRQEVENSLAQEVHFSQMLQQALLPVIPDSVRGYRAASVYIPAYASREIGGDFIDLFETEDGKVAMLIGDVSGKGLEAASYAAEARSTIRSFAYELSSPAEALTHANAVLSANREIGGLFVTVYLVIADPATHEILCSGAGHPPAALCRPDGTVEFTRYGDLPIGIVSDLHLHESKEYLDPGTKIVLYTDGITEARHGGELFGLEGVERVLKGCAEATPKAVVDGLVNAAKEWSVDHLRDDTAVMVVEVMESLP